MKRPPLRKLASHLLKKPSRILGEVNSNATMLEWSKQHRTPHIYNTRFALYDHVNAHIGSDTIDYLEFGVFKGESILRWADIHRNEASRFFGFDSFEGLPEDWVGASMAKTKGHFSTDGQIPQTDDARVQFVKGWFQDTLGHFLNEYAPKGRIILHNDSDLYSPTLYTLTMMDSLLIRDSILIFDEFYSSSHEFQAFYDYSRSYLRKYRLLGAVGENPYRQIAILMD